jgi:putative ABC transport system permease protein
MGIAVLLTYFGLPPRPTYTITSVFLLVFWLLGAGERLNAIFGELHGDIEMFFLSGAAMVTASTFVIIYNSDIFLAFVSRVGGVFGPLLPALRTAIAYPMANRFRTGMTLAMISIVVFALTMMSAMNLNYDKLFLADDSRGGWDVQVVENPNNPIPTVAGAISEVGSPAQNDIRAEGAILSTQLSITEVTQKKAGEPEDWTDYPVHGMTNSFIDNSTVPLEKRAAGYDSDQAVWQALKTDSGVAVADGFVTQGGGFGGDQFVLDGIPTDTDVYSDPPVVTVRDSVSGISKDVKIIGITSFGASSNFMGFQLGEQAWRSVYGDPGYSVHYLSLNPGSDSDNVAKAIESALVTSGAQADSLTKIAEEANALSRNFLYLMQAFMGLGLVVGIAAIGVIAFRTVVERRQQIGMLRAIGYKKSTVALSFLIESSFVTVLGVASGTILGLLLAYFLVTSDSFPAKNQAFHIPWLQTVFFAVVTLLASLAMTWIPARQASSVPTAEALRYE